MNDTKSTTNGTNSATNGAQTPQGEEKKPVVPQPEELGALAALGLAIKSPIKAAAIGGLMIATVGDALYNSRNLVAKSVRKSIRLTAATMLAAVEEGEETMIDADSDNLDDEALVMAIRSNWKK